MKLKENLVTIASSLRIRFLIKKSFLQAFAMSWLYPSLFPYVCILIDPIPLSFCKCERNDLIPPPLPITSLLALRLS